MEKKDFRILVVDDEESLCEILQVNLELEGYRVDTALSAEQALEMGPEHYHLLLLDVMMDGMSGFELAERLKARPETAAVPIIFCTAKDTEEDTVRGLNLGGDDYISKPFSIQEAMARVQSVLRRSYPKKTKANETVSFGTLVLDLTNKSCTVDGKEVPLTKKEFEILSLLLRNTGRVFSREELLSQVWSDDVIVVDRTIDVNITRLRRKIAPYGKNIVTRIGYGYGFEA